MVAILFSLAVAFARVFHTARSACIPTAELGCLNGKAFNRSTEFVCGASVCDASYQNCQPAIYQWAVSSCCAQGVAFDKRNSFCCYEGVHDNSVGVCKPWSVDFPQTCGCYSGGGRRLSVQQGTSQIANDPAVVDTNVPAGQPCSSTLPTRGCLNGYLYDYSTQMPCGDYLVNLQSHGCCTTEDGIKPYNLQTQSCCKFGGSNEVLDGARACTCSKCTTTSTTTSTTTTTTSTSTTSTTTSTTNNMTDLETTSAFSTTLTLQTTAASIDEGSVATGVSTTSLARSSTVGSDEQSMSGGMRSMDKAESMSGGRARFISAWLLSLIAMLVCTE